MKLYCVRNNYYLRLTTANTATRNHQPQKKNHLEHRQTTIKHTPTTKRNSHTTYNTPFPVATAEVEPLVRLKLVRNLFDFFPNRPTVERNAYPKLFIPKKCVQSQRLKYKCHQQFQLHLINFFFISDLSSRFFSFACFCNKKNLSSNILCSFEFFVYHQTK